MNTFKNLRKNLQQRLWFFILSYLPINKSSGRVGNRFRRITMLGPIEVTVTYRDTREQDGYSREELYSMLKLVRQHEIQQNWKVPEPN